MHGVGEAVRARRCQLPVPHVFSMGQVQVQVVPTPNTSPPRY